MRYHGFRLLLLGALLSAVTGCNAQAPIPREPMTDPFGRGINIGNALEAPNEGDWGVSVLEAYVQAIADAGFDSVRLPVKWSGHAAAEAPYTIDPAFLARVDEVVGWVLDRGLSVILDFHHYDEMSTQPDAHVERWLGIWLQLAQHYRDAPAELAFELLNEPNQQLGGQLWNDMITQALAVVRETNPTRTVVVGPGSWNAIGALSQLSLPADDHLVLTVHYYEPFAFTHQGADWVSPPPPTGVTWTGAGHGPAGGWHDWSWDTEREYGSGVTLTYLAGWAGFYLQADEPVTGYTHLVLSTSRTVDLLIQCSAGDGGGLAVTLSAGVESHIALAACGADEAGVPRLFLQNGTPDPQPPFDVTLLELRGPAGTLPLVATEAAAIGVAFDTVQRWAAAHGDLPVLVGEFGAFEAADMPSRVAWTAAVRRAAEEHGFGWAYWEFGAGFGVYDREVGAWRQPLLDALLAD